MRRMHERQNIGKVVLIPEAKTETPAPEEAKEDAAAAAGGEGGER